MDPNEIELTNLSKQFAYQKIATDIDNCNDTLFTLIMLLVSGSLARSL